MTDGKKKVTARERLRKFANFAYNRENRTVFGRTALSWLLIILFYIVFYALLAAFFIGMLFVLLYGVIEESQPKLTGAQSLLRFIPSIDYKPRIIIDSTLINYKPSDPSSYAPYVKNIQQLYNSYSSINTTLDSPLMAYADCNLTDPQANRGWDPARRICRLNPAIDWGNCNQSSQYGYAEGKPCIVVKMNRMFGWIPTLVPSAQVNHTLLSCTSENDGDKPNVGKVEYFPGVTINGTSYGYFSSALFPFLNQPGYTSPSVAVKFSGIRRNVLVMIQCQLANVAGLVIDRPNRVGLIHFEMLIRTA